MFGPQAKLIGCDRLILSDVNFPVRVDELMPMLIHHYPDLSASIGVSRLAVNHEFAAADSLINAGDEVALVGLISGG
ncbi:MoaD/ThiS family protein [Aporhodopirellula aestuarii]|uniref:MoaD/ThiS family protein n=1 Tax=Aporhodopirellula aestuarii TaxID=2950107 RepID=A0ABT0UA13_9BACT|nr:MoaD/ThiS family protein [Aporhodopirellula aestuarii]MCM2373181.1 MoaD/ThiS family protein [Aporhodopirellula aestuarii]